MFKGLTGLGSLLKQAQEISGRMKGLNEQLRARRATGSAGGGMVEVEVNGLLEVLGCHIDQQLFEQGDREMVEIGRSLGAAVKLCGSGGAVVGAPSDPRAFGEIEKAYRDSGYPLIRPEIRAKREEEAG